MNSPYGVISTFFGILKLSNKGVNFFLLFKSQVTVPVNKVPSHLFFYVIFFLFSDVSPSSPLLLTPSVLFFHNDFCLSPFFRSFLNLSLVLGLFSCP